MSARWLLLLAACSSPLEPREPSTPYPRTPVTDAAAEIALACGQAHGLVVRQPYLTLELRLVQAEYIDVFGVRAHGFFHGTTIWVIAALRDVVQIWAHEMLHVLYGLPGRPGVKHPPIFAACGL